jgi:hypothetical protein
VPEFDYVDWYRNSHERIGTILDQDEEEGKSTEIPESGDNSTSSAASLSLDSNLNETQSSSEETEINIPTLSSSSSSSSETSTSTEESCANSQRATVQHWPI